MKILKRILLALVLLIGSVMVIFLAGPRVDTTITLERLSLPDDLDSYLSTQEANFSDIKAEAEKKIIWANEPGEKTEYALVYLHGFSATRQETAPLMDKLGQRLNANVFNTRYTGHGRSNDAMAETSVNAWANDTNEAFEIGKRLGEHVILVGVSTGATLATWFASTQPNNLAGMILISPNFGPFDPNSEFLTLPWGEQLANAIIGPERSWKPDNDGHAQFWTYQYPTKAILPVMGAVKITREANLETIDVPIQMIYSEKDTVINVSKALETFGRFGSDENEAVIENNSGDSSNHVLAGDILAPSATARMVDTIATFITNL